MTVFADPRLADQSEIDSLAPLFAPPTVPLPGTNVPNVHGIGTRPSCPSASIASAAIVPTSIPAVLRGPFGIPASEAS